MELLTIKTKPMRNIGRSVNSNDQNSQEYDSL